MNSHSRASKIVALLRKPENTHTSTVSISSVRRSTRLRLDYESYDSHEGATEQERDVLLSQRHLLLLEAPDFEEHSQPLMSDVITSSHDPTPCDETLQISDVPVDDKTLQSSDIDSSVYVSSGDSYIPSSLTSTFEASAETNCIEEIHNPNITPSVVSHSSSSDQDIHISTIKKVNGKRKRNKRHCCYFCNKVLSNNMARHFETVHKHEMEVAKILALPKGSKLRKTKFGSLIRSGDFYYNCNILTLKAGRLILVRRPDKNTSFSYSDFVPCPNCLGFMAKKYIWHHLKHSCAEKKITSNNCDNQRVHLNESAALLFQPRGNNFSEVFKKEIVATFRLDDVSQECKGDDLILKFGSFLFEKYGTKQLELIRQTMRQVGRFKIELKICTIPSLSCMLTPQNFDNIITATRNLCRTSMGEDASLNYKIPSLALKIGHHLRKCIAIDRGMALRTGNMQRAEELRNLTELINNEWSVKISSNALLSLHRKKLNATQLLPLTSDLMKLNSYLVNEVNLLTEKVTTSCNAKLWMDLASVTLCRIILFNKRRSGEASRMTVENYSTRPSWNEQTTSEFKESLTLVEKELANRLVVVQIIGKRNRIVPVLMPPDVKVAIDTLIKKRDDGEISSDNRYVFARSVGCRVNRYLQGHQCLRKACENAGLVCAKNITSTKLRKYMATVCQIFDLKEHELDWLARHLGHDIRVHRDFYRMHESAIELTKVSRLLLAVESGKANKFSGRGLHDINIEELSDIEEDQEIVDKQDREDNEGNKHLVTDSTDSSSDDDTSIHSEDMGINSTSDDDREDGASSSNRQSRKFRSKTRTQIASGKKGKVKSQKKKISKTPPAVRKSWSTDALAFVSKFFNRDLKHKRVPGKTACEACISKSGNVLEGRKWTDIKFCVKNLITRQSRLSATLI